MISGIIKVEIQPYVLSAEADNIYRDLDYSGYHKNLLPQSMIVLVYIFICFEENNDKHIVARNVNQ